MSKPVGYRKDGPLAYYCEGDLYCPEHTVIEPGDLECSHVIEVYAGHEWLEGDQCCTVCGREFAPH